MDRLWLIVADGNMAEVDTEAAEAAEAATEVELVNAGVGNLV